MGFQQRTAVTAAESVVALAAVETFGSRDADWVELDAIVHILESMLATNGQRS